MNRKLTHLRANETIALLRRSAPCFVIQIGGIHSIEIHYSKAGLGR